MRLGEVYDVLEQLNTDSAPSALVEAVLEHVTDVYAPDHYEVLKCVLQHPKFEVIYTGAILPEEADDAATSQETGQEETN